jgi:serine kinase of HPr protein (carbohydrate metabolism regulator)
MSILKSQKSCLFEIALTHYLEKIREATTQEEYENIFKKLGTLTFIINDCKTPKELLERFNNNEFYPVHGEEHKKMLMDVISVWVKRWL